MSKKTFRGLIALILIVIVVAAAWVAGWQITGKMNPADWFGNNDNNQDQTNSHIIAVTSDGKKLIADNSYAMPRAMTFVNKSSSYSKSKEFNVTATLSNQYINGLFDWEVSFVDPTSSWAVGKSAEYYVQVQPITDGSATATVKYFSSFNEPIKVTATLRDTDKSDSCTVDCLKNFEMTDCWIDLDDFGFRLEGGCSLDCTTGTAFADYRVQYIRLCIDSAFEEAIKSYLKFDIEIHSFYFNELFTENLVVEEQSDLHLQLLFMNEHLLSYADFIENFDAFDDEHKEAIKYAWYHAAKDNYVGNFEFGVEAYVHGVATGITTGFDKFGEISGEADGKDIQPSVTLNTNVIF